MSDIALDRLPPLGAQPPSTDRKLRDAAQQLEGVFVEQLFKSMRETVPDGGVIDGGSGEEIFSSLMDQHLAAQVPADWERGLGAALYRQLRGSAPAETGNVASPTALGGKY